MPYNFPLDPMTPTGADPVASGDDRIRELKQALEERLGQLFGNWPDGDPLELDEDFWAEFLREGVGLVALGTLALRPNPPTAAGLLYYATDEKQLFISVPSGENFVWEVVGGSGSGAPPGGFQGQEFRNADWVADPPTVTGAVETRQLHVIFRGTISVQGILTIPLNSVAPNHHVADLLGVLIGTATAPVAYQILAKFASVDSPTNVVRLLILRTADNTSVPEDTEVTVSVLMTFGANYD